jgi:hypothetical protein
MRSGYSFLILFRGEVEIILSIEIYIESAEAPKMVVVLFLLNLLTLTGHVMHQQFNIQQLYVLPKLCLNFFLFIWEQTATCASYIINYLVITTEMKSVYCAVRTGSLNKAVCHSS